MAKDLEQIVNERVLTWRARQRKLDGQPFAGPSTRAAGTEQHHMIAISREYGSLGSALGRALAGALGVSFYSQDLVHEIAMAAHVSDDIVATMDEQAHGRLDGMIREMLAGEAFTDDDYLHYLKGVLRLLARRGPGVVIGRGGHLILQVERTLRVRTYAKIESRVENVVRREGLSPDRARAKILEMDRQRSVFYRRYFGIDVANPENFDLMLNTGDLAVSQCVRIVRAAFQARFD